ncbi:hypothetical protein DFJ74DRAFT_600434 [Hyaloraphidium curvatum]|nr:hypothetical protein DFJ74DRAFT_600434 [Hyaloraphidium curvatum]
MAGGGGRLRQLNRTATFAWSPGPQLPLLAVGTVAGALDASFSTATELEIVDLGLDADDGASPHLNGADASRRFNRLAWSMAGGPHGSKEHGILAGGLENGELGLWNPAAIINGGESLLTKTGAHSGPVRGLDFNPLQPNLLSTGSNDGEIFIWDLANPTKPYAPATKSTKLEDVTCVAWNRQVAHILASASTNGYTVIWDLRNRRELIQLAHPGGRKGITAISWNPDTPTQIVTASDDDNSPALLVWDLKNARAPEKSLVGHTKGVLSVAWCPKDSDLMLSCGKDNRTLLWNPSTTENLGTVDVTGNWAFEVQWCPRNPDLLAIGGFDGIIAVHSLQRHGTGEADHAGVAVGVTDDPFAFGAQGNDSKPAISLQRPPKWMRRPCGASFSFGGKLLCFRNSTKPEGNAAVPSVVSLVVATEPTFDRRVAAAEDAALSGTSQSFAALCQSLAQSVPASSEDRDVWLFLSKLFSDTPRAEIVKHLGFNAPSVSADGYHPVSRSVASLERPIHPTEGTAPFALYPDVIATADPQGAARPLPVDLSNELTKSLVAGDLGACVEKCLAAEQFTDALLLAVCGGPDLLSRTRAAVLQKMMKEKPYARVLGACLDGRVVDVVRGADLTGKRWKDWKDLLVLICTYAAEADFPPACELLAGKIGERAKSAAADEKPSLDLAALLVQVAAGDAANVLERWVVNGMSAKGPPTVLRERLALLQDLAEKLLVLRQCLDIEGALETSGFTPGIRALLFRYAQFAECVANEGNLDWAWRSLERIPAHSFEDEHEQHMVAVLRDRVFQALSETTQASVGNVPEAAFEINEMGLVPVETHGQDLAAPSHLAQAPVPWSGEGLSAGSYQIVPPGPPQPQPPAPYTQQPGPASYTYVQQPAAMPSYYGQPQTVAPQSYAPLGPAVPAVQPGVFPLAPARPTPPPPQTSSLPPPAFNDPPMVSSPQRFMPAANPRVAPIVAPMPSSQPASVQPPPAMPKAPTFGFPPPPAAASTAIAPPPQNTWTPAAVAPPPASNFSHAPQPGAAGSAQQIPGVFATPAPPRPQGGVGVPTPGPQMPSSVTPRTPPLGMGGRAPSAGPVQSAPPPVAEAAPPAKKRLRKLPSPSFSYRL